MNTSYGVSRRQLRHIRKPSSNRYNRIFLIIGALLLCASLVLMVWVTLRAIAIKKELSSVQELLQAAKAQVAANDTQGAVETLSAISAHLSRSKSYVEEPSWKIATSTPWLGQNFLAVSEVVTAADDMAGPSLQPMIALYSQADLERFLPSRHGSDIDGLENAISQVSISAQHLELSSSRISSIKTAGLLPFIAEPIVELQDKTESFNKSLHLGIRALSVIPAALGRDSPRHYLLMIQNNSEARATGGIPGAVAVLTIDRGTISLGPPANGGTIGIMSPTIPVGAEQEEIYSKRLGKYLQDVNLTPDFPTSARLATQMWERYNGQVLDGAISIDPVALSYLLAATGPLDMKPSVMVPFANSGLPPELTAENVVRTLLADVYQKIDDPSLQDAYFASVAAATFDSVSDGKIDVVPLSRALGKAADERRLLLWSRSEDEEEAIDKLDLSGTIAANRNTADFGVYFNDSTGAKMDYFVKRKVQLVKECVGGGYNQTIVRITSTNTAPRDAATSLPAYVTGGGVFGVPPGSVQTNVIAYGPAQAEIESVALAGEKTPFAPHTHDKRPVGVVSLRLAPGESKTLEFRFAKVEQRYQLRLFITPLVQSTSDVVEATEETSCDQTR